MKKIVFLLIPFITFGQVQIGSDISGEFLGDFSGWSVSLSSDGSIVAIGEPYNDGNAPDSGQVRIYENQSGNWIQLGTDIEGGSYEDESGWSVSLSSDGFIVAIGSIRNNGNGENSGHVRIYENQSNNWVQLGSDINGESAGDLSGWSVSLSSDGSIVAIGSFLNNGNGISSGHVRIYENQSNNWVQLGSDIDGEEEVNESGRSVSLSADGLVVAIGAVRNNENGINSGHVRIYENQSNNWVQLGSDIDGEAEGDFSGMSVSLSADGSLIAIGAPFNDGNGIDSGHVRIYENQSNNWVQLGSDIDGEAEGDFSGMSVSLSANGLLVAIGATENNGNSTDLGHVRIYENQFGNWEQLGSDIDGETVGDFSGISVNLSDNGSVVAIGSVGNDEGYVKIYDLSSLLKIEKQTLLNFNIYPNPTKTKFTIQLENTTELKNVTIYNNLGQQVLTSKKSVIDTSKLASGLYLVEIETNKGKSSKKLIIE